METPNPEHTIFDFYQERNFSELLNTSVAFLRHNFKSLFIVVLVITSPILLPVLFYLTSQFITQSSSGGMSWLTIATVGVTYMSLLNGAVNGYVEVYQRQQHTNKPNVTIKEVWQALKGRFFSLWAYTIVAYAFSAIASVFLIIPGVYFLIVCSVGWAVVFHEKLNPVKAIGRCSYLFAGGNSWLTGFMLALIMAIVAFALSFTESMVWLLLSLILGDIPGINQWLGVIFIGVYVVLLASLAIVPSLIYTFMYYSLVEQKDSVGLIAKIDNFGKE